MAAPLQLYAISTIALLTFLYIGRNLFYSIHLGPSNPIAPEAILRYSQFAGRPYTVSYDSRAFKLNGARTLLLGGSVHYPRLAVEEWEPMLEEMARDGLNHLQLYVFWNYHEPEPPQFDQAAGRFNHKYDFSGRGDLVRFIRLAGQKDLFVNLRIGPYVCAEWTFGGLPLWLRDVDGMCFRSVCDYQETSETCRPWEDGSLSGCDPWRKYMAEFVLDIANLVKEAKLMASQGGPIIMAQLENEYGANTEAGTAYIDWVGELSFGLGLEVPWVMCNGLSANGTVNVCNGDDCADEYKASHDERWPDEPLGWTENEGWFDTWGGSFGNSERSAEEMAYVVAKWVAVGGSHHNYYMWYGGNHLAQWGAASLTNAYANGVNFRSDGLPNEPKRSHLRRLHGLLGRLNGELMRVDDRHSVKPIRLEENVEVYEWTDQLAFLHRPACSNGSVSVQYKGVTYSIKCREVLVIDPSTGTVHFATASTEKPPELVTRVIANLTLSRWSMRQERIEHGMDVVVDSEPIDHLRVAGLATDYVTYKTRILAGPGSNTSTLLEIESSISQVFHVSLDGGKSLVSTVMNVEKGNTRWTAAVELPALTRNASYDLWIISESLGVENGMLYGAPAAREPSLLKGILGDVRLNGTSIRKNNWTMVKGLDGEAIRGQVTADTPCCKALGPAWFTAEFDLDRPVSGRSISLQLPNGLPNTAGGHIWLNGVDLGRWRAVATGDGYRQSAYRLPPDALLEGTNKVSVFSATGYWVSEVEQPPAVIERSYKAQAMSATEYLVEFLSSHPLCVGPAKGLTVSSFGQMFSCRFCSESPFAKLFGEDPAAPDFSRRQLAGDRTNRQTRRSPSSFVRRNPEEIKQLIASWEPYVSSRARDFFVTRERLEEVLTMIARSIHHTEDPILGDDSCVFWYGEVTKDDNQAVIRMVKPTEETESLTYVNRVMVLIFSSDEVFQQLMALPKAPFRMACGNQLCVSLHHVALN
ncbi:Beta-galactosidase 6 [Perkinsus chesapeaki]|uniref:Beta-galactosidase n=1 Tax=Perkinsus chesapeaki TaxID=330153 RepID=A0A7J6L7U2_PERCH|nr:Beta-galactosidase 6 [Perkinsus chesapeaki]